MNVERASKKQRELLSFVDGFIKGNGYGPSYREIMRALGYKSVSTVAVHIDGLITRGYLIKRTHSARSLEVVTDASIGIKSDVSNDHEKWLVGLVNKKLAECIETKQTAAIQETRLLAESLRIIGLDDAYSTVSKKLDGLS